MIFIMSTSEISVPRFSAFVSDIRSYEGAASTSLLFSISLIAFPSLLDMFVVCRCWVQRKNSTQARVTGNKVAWMGQLCATLGDFLPSLKIDGDDST